MSRFEHKREAVEPSAVRPTYLDWRGLSIYASCSKRWLQAHVPPSLRFRVDGKVLIRLQEFDSWIERFREGQDVDRVLTEVMEGLKRV